MSNRLYDVDGNILNSAYDINGNRLLVAYDVANNQYTFGITNEYTEKADEILHWINSYAVDSATNGKRIKERYRLDTGAWVSMHRVYINMQAIVCFFHVWKYTGNEYYLTLGRQVFDSISLLQRENGSYRAADATDGDTYVNGNSGNAVLMLQMAQLDTERASTYIASALRVTEYLIGLQLEDGSFPASAYQPVPSPMFTGHAITALAAAYSYTDNKSAYATAINKAIEYIENNTLQDGRVKCCYEMNTRLEYWRPPMSDQSVCALALAFAEYYLPNDSNVATWRTLRYRLLDYLDSMIAPVGAVRNGPGSNINGADIYGLTDHVYTTNFAWNAYYFSWLADGTERYKITAKKILDFCLNNFYYSTNPNANGVLRGAWNIQDENWDTSELILNATQEGGADMIYTGWINLPVAQWFYDIAYGQF